MVATRAADAADATSPKRRTFLLQGDRKNAFHLEIYEKKVQSKNQNFLIRTVTDLYI